ncbi:MAG: LysM peptidoglycan-binding domain-containing protein [Deltaproteobacteria bacterium]|nr:LysM peptidoglycan-binding domain-containing protein [Deltaproteobacteria bacterium]
MKSIFPRSRVLGINAGADESDVRFPVPAHLTLRRLLLLGTRFRLEMNRMPRMNVLPRTRRVRRDPILRAWLFSVLVLLFPGCALWSGSTRGVDRIAEAPGDAWATAGTSTGTLAHDFDLEDELAATIEATDASGGDAAVADPRRPFVRPVLTETGTIAYDIPMIEDPRVDQWVEYLTGRGRHWYERWLARSTRFVPLFWSILERHEVPRDLVFLSMIESGFSPHAYSVARAAGPWQFMEKTAKSLDLRVDFWVDERRDFEKSTDAAARYLKALYGRFGDWHLAMAAYNAGGARVARAMRASGRRDFWTLSRTSRLRRETRQYVPKLLAAARVGKQADRYGFAEVEYQEPLAWDVVTVKLATDLKSLAQLCGVDVEQTLRDLNPALRWAITPPGESYVVRVPKGVSDVCRANLEAAEADVEGAEGRLTYRYHRLGRDETVQSLSERFQVPVERMLEVNRRTLDDLETVEGLIVPVPLAMASSLPIEEPPSASFPGDRYRPSGVRRIVHVVRAGESLWTIGRRYRVSVKMLRLWNGRWTRRPLRVGEKLAIYPGPSGPKAAGRSTRGLRAAAPHFRPSSNLGSSSSVKTLTSEVLVSSRNSKAGRSSSSHRVRSGESLWTIAQRYGTTVDWLVRMNGLPSSRPILPGQVLRVD